MDLLWDRHIQEESLGTKKPPPQELARNSSCLRAVEESANKVVA
jgi:hypothetical protein